MPFVLYAIFAGEDRLVRFFPDEALYYLQPAANFAAHGLASFDGVHTTNGFHPLNFLIVAGLALLFPSALRFSATFALHSGLLVAALMLVTGYLQRLTAAVRVLAAAISLLPLFTLFILAVHGHGSLAGGVLHSFFDFGLGPCPGKSVWIRRHEP